MNSAPMQREPAVIIGAIGLAIIAAIEALAPEFFPDLEVIFVQAVQVLVAILTIAATRLKVWSPASVDAAIKEAGDGPSPES